MACGIGLAVAAVAGPAQAVGAPGSAGAVYTRTNAPGGNAIEAYARASDGSLTSAPTAAGSGGIGTN